MPASVVGRDTELAALSSFLAGISDGAAALVLEGEAGMGKTTLWRAGIADAAGRGLRVLQAQPAESETTLSFSGIGDLLDPVLEESLAPLSAGQRGALARALILDAEEGPPPDPHAVGVALLNALRGLASARPIVVAVDDVQWLDAASAGALTYASRRLEGEPVGLLLSWRSGLESSLVEELRRASTGRFTEVEVGPLGVAELHQVVRQQLGVALPRPLLAEVHTAADGNPFYALEIVRMLRRSDLSIEAGQPIPVPDSLHDLVHGRLLALPSESREFLLAASAHAHPTLSNTEAASGITRAAGITPALEARVVELDGERIRFTHPLLAAGAYEIADPLRRREIHVRLAEILDDPEARAWQLAASADEPDEDVAAALDEAARYARSRGALRPAALLLDRSCELTPADRRDQAVRRGTAAAYAHLESGDSQRAEAQLRRLVAPLDAGAERARALAVLARIRLYEAPDEARELFLQIIEEAGDDRHTLAVAHEGVAACSTWMFKQFDEALHHTGIALSLASDLGDDALAADALISRLTAESVLGLPAAAATAERALALQVSASNARVLDQPLVSVAEYWLRVDQLERAREALIELVHSAQELGDENAKPWLLFQLGEAECARGDLANALALAREGQEASEQSRQPLFDGLCLALESVVQARLGLPEEAKLAADRALEISRDGLIGLVSSAALGHLALSSGRPGDAVAQLDARVAFLREEGIVEPGASVFVVDDVEALLELGRRDEAEELLHWYEGNARRLERASALANCARCRGLLAAQDGALDEALADYGEALAWHAKVEFLLDRGRTLLALGATQRRMKRRREARATLEEALAVFEGVGAALWAERARAELKRISGRAATPGALTPAEERVATLVAEGKTNREVAAALFLSDRTVEGHLAHIFGKLGIRHRTEIAAALAARQTQGIAASNTGDSPVSAEPSVP